MAQRLLLRVIINCKRVTCYQCVRISAARDGPKITIQLRDGSLMLAASEIWHPAASANIPDIGIYRLGPQKLPLVHGNDNHDFG